MGLTRTKIRIVNSTDFEKSYAGDIGQDKVRQFEVNAVVDTGAGPLVINEALRQKLGLRLMDEWRVGQAGGSHIQGHWASTVLVFWQGSTGPERWTSQTPLVLPDESETLLGYLALEAMDLRVNPTDKCVEGAHGDFAVYSIK
jgi:predicted aspartyl protease